MHKYALPFLGKVEEENKGMLWERGIFKRGRQDEICYHPNTFQLVGLAHFGGYTQEESVGKKRLENYAKTGALQNWYIVISTASGVLKKWSEASQEKF